MSKSTNKLSPQTVENWRGIIGEEMVGDLIDAEVLFYYLYDKMGLKEGIKFYDITDDDSGRGKFIGFCNAIGISLEIHNGGRKMYASEISRAVNRVRRNGLDRKQVHFFLKKYMKSSRIEVISKAPLVWQMNGFSTFERPYLAGYEREMS